MPVLLAIVLVAALLFAVPALTQQRERTVELRRCDALQDAIARRSVQGGDRGELAALEAEYRTCIADAQASGARIDSSAASLALAGAMATQIRQEWEHYRSTADVDFVKRSNTRNTILRTGAEMADTLKRAVGEARSVASLDAIAAFMNEQASETWNRMMCFETGASGCSRSGVSEPDWDERERDEWARVLAPLVGPVANVGLADTTGRSRSGRARPNLDVVNPDGWPVPASPPEKRLRLGLKPEQSAAIADAGRASVRALLASRRAEIAPGAVPPFSLYLQPIDPGSALAALYRPPPGDA